MKKLYLFLLFSAATSAFGQYCMPTCKIYFSTMPGITNFSLNTINRTSADCEAGCPTNGNNFVTTAVTQQTTNLVRGQSYSVSMTFTVDAPISPDMNLRVYIDYNKNFKLDDTGETVVTANNKLPGAFTATIAIPTNAALGSTRLRAAAKMTSNGGHTLPTPCNVPPDPIDYHGEMEDYTVNIIDATGIDQLPGDVNYFTVLPSVGASGLEVMYGLGKSSKVTLQLYDGTGKLVESVFLNQQQPAGQYEATVGRALDAGVYLVRVIVNGAVATRKVIITG